MSEKICREAWGWAALDLGVELTVRSQDAAGRRITCCCASNWHVGWRVRGAPWRTKCRSSPTMTNYYLPLTSCLKLPAITASVRGKVGCWGGQYSGKTARVFVKVIHSYLRTRECVTQPPSFLFQLIKKNWSHSTPACQDSRVVWAEKNKTKSFC